ncbi:hypothetical protein D3C72_1824860 [compost metagenome]
MLHVAWHVLCGAGRGVGAWQAEDSDLLALDQVLHVERVRAQCATFGFAFDEFGQGAFWQGVADLDGHVDSLCTVG